MAFRVFFCVMEISKIILSEAEPILGVLAVLAKELDAILYGIELVPEAYDFILVGSTDCVFLFSDSSCNRGVTVKVSDLKVRLA